MIDFTKGAAVLAVALAVAAASPALAAKRAKAPGHEARAQAVGSDVTGSTSTMSNNRASALRECSAKAEGMKQYTWGVQQGSMFRNCMAEHGQVE